MRFGIPEFTFICTEITGALRSSSMTGGPAATNAVGWNGTAWVTANATNSVANVQCGL